MLNVDDVIADGEVAEVGDEGGGLGFFRRGAGGNVGFVEEILRAEEDEARIGQADAGGERSAQNDGRAQVAGKVAGFVVDVFAARVLDAAAEAVGEFVFAQKIGEALDFALVGARRATCERPGSSGCGFAR